MELKWWGALGIGLMMAAFAGGCNLETDDGVGPGLLDAFGGGMLPDGGVLENGNAILTAGNFTLYSSWGSEWDQGACVELRLKNSGPTAVGWSLGLKVNTDLKKWVYEDGGYLDWTGDYLAIDPENGDTKLKQGESHLFHYCAEPKTKPVEFWVWGGIETGGTTDPGGDGCLSCGGSGSGSGSGGWPTTSSGTKAVLLRNGEGYTLTAKATNSWAQGGCVEVTLYATKVGKEDWSLHMPLERPVTTFTDGSMGDLWVEFDDAANQINVFRLDGEPLLVGDREVFYYCTEPLSLPRKNFSVAGTPIQGGGTAGAQTAIVEQGIPHIGLMLSSLDYQLNGGDCYKLSIRNFEPKAITITGFKLGFPAPVEMSEAQGGIGMGWPSAGSTMFDFPVPDWMGALPANGSSPSSPSICFSPWYAPTSVSFTVKP